MFIFIRAFINNLSWGFHSPKTIIFLPLSVDAKLKADPLGVPLAAKPPPPPRVGLLVLRCIIDFYVINRPGIQSYYITCGSRCYRKPRRTTYANSYGHWKTRLHWCKCPCRNPVPVQSLSYTLWNDVFRSCYRTPSPPRRCQSCTTCSCIHQSAGRSTCMSCGQNCVRTWQYRQCRGL